MRIRDCGIAALIAVSVAGCSRSSVPSDSFRLSASSVFTDEAQHVWLVSIESSDGDGYSVGCTNALGSSSSWGAFPQPANGLNHARIWIAASRVAVRDSAHDLVQTIIRGGGESTEVRQVPRGTPLTNSIAVTIHDGSYRLDEPLVIGRMYGGDIILPSWQDSTRRVWATDATGSKSRSNQLSRWAGARPSPGAASQDKGGRDGRIRRGGARETRCARGRAHPGGTVKILPRRSPQIFLKKPIAPEIGFAIFPAPFDPVGPGQHNLRNR